MYYLFVYILCYQFQNNIGVNNYFIIYTLIQAPTKEIIHSAEQPIALHNLYKPQCFFK